MFYKVEKFPTKMFDIFRYIPIVIRVTEPISDYKLSFNFRQGPKTYIKILQKLTFRIPRCALCDI